MLGFDCIVRPVKLADSMLHRPPDIARDLPRCGFAVAPSWPTPRPA